MDQSQATATAYFNNTATFTEYYNTFFSRLMVYARRVFGNDIDSATIVVNDVLMKIGMGDNYEYNPAKSHLSYLITTTHRASINLYRKHRKVITESALGAIEDSDNNSLEYYVHKANDDADYELVGDDHTPEDDIDSVAYQAAICMAMIKHNGDPVVSDAINAIMGGKGYTDVVDKHDDIGTTGAVKTRKSRFTNKLRAKMIAARRYRDLCNGQIVTGDIALFARKRDTGEVYLSIEGSCKDGMMHGRFTRYWPGTSTQKTTYGYKNGLLHGRQTEFYQDGTINTVRKYKDGELVSYDEYNEDGSLFCEFRTGGGSSYLGVYEGGEVYENIF